MIWRHLLPRHAISSAKSGKDGKDGISYLVNNIASGIETKLTPDYETAVLKQTKTGSLKEALKYAKEVDEKMPIGPGAGK